MAEYIEREKAFDAILKLTPKVDDDGYCWVIRGDAAMAIDSIPAADVRPVVRGKWILYKDRDSTGKFEYVQWSCSACKSNVRTGQPRLDSTLRERPRFNFCPNCGAEMREES